MTKPLEWVWVRWKWGWGSQWSKWHAYRRSLRFVGFDSVCNIHEARDVGGWRHQMEFTADTPDEKKCCAKCWRKVHE